MQKKDLVVLERIIIFIVCIALFLRLFILHFYNTISPVEEAQLLPIRGDISNIIISYFIIFGFIIFLIKLLLTKEVFPRTSLDLFLILFIIIAASSMLYSADRCLTLKEWLALSTNIAVFYLVVGCINSAYRLKLFIRFFIGLGLCVSLHGLIGYFFIYDDLLKVPAFYSLSEAAKHMISIKRIGSVFGWPNAFAGFLILILPLSFIYVFILKNRWQRYGMALITFAIFLAMLFTYSISAWISLIIAAIISCGFYLRFKQRESTKKTKATKIVFFLLALILLFAILLIIWRRSTPFTISSFNSRVEYIRSTLLMIKSHPILGNGLGVFRVIISNYMNSPAGFSFYAHNSYLQIWAETGIIGVLLFFLIIFFIIKESKKAIQNFKEQKGYLLSLGLFCAVLALLLDNMQNYTMFLTRVSLFWWTLVAIIFARAKNHTIKE